MHTDAFLIGKKVILRPAIEQDATHLTRWINNPHVRKYLIGRMPMSLLAEKDWVTKISKFERFPESIVMVIETRSKNTPIGLMGLHDINWIDRNGATGSLIGELNYQGKGYANDAKMLFLKYAFQTLGLHKVSSRAHADNIASIRYSLRCGYVHEARLTEEIFMDGAWHDIVQLACFAHTWKEACTKYGWTDLV